MTNSLSPRTRAAIINYDPTQPNALTITEFCRSVKISRSVFYKIRTRAAQESTAALHPRSRAPKTPGPPIRPRSHQRAGQDPQTPQNTGLGLKAEVHLARVQHPRILPGRTGALGGHDRAPAGQRGAGRGLPEETPEILLHPFRQVHSDVGTTAYLRHENSTDAKETIQAAIAVHGAPGELLSDNSSAFNQLRQGMIGAVEIFLASKGTMPISGLPGRPTTQGKNERSHQTLIRFLDANRPATVQGMRGRIQRYREHYNTRRPHQALDQATPATAWNLLEHTPATEPIPMAVLEAKASEYRQRRQRRNADLDRAALTISKTGEILPAEDALPQAADQMLIEVTRENRQVYYHGYHIKMPTTVVAGQYYRTITDEAFMLTDPVTGQIVFSFPLPMRALHVRNRYVASYSVQGVEMANPSKHWQRKHAEYAQQFAQREEDLPEVFTC